MICRFIGIGLTCLVALRADPVAVAPTPSPASEPSYHAEAGPWGHLHVTPFRLAPTAQAVNRLQEVDSSRWFFTDRSWSQIEDFLRQAPLQPAQRALLLAPDLREEHLDGRQKCIRLPDDLRLSLSIEARTFCYRTLAEFEGNLMQTMPYLVPSDARLQAAQISDPVRERLTRLSFLRGNRRCVADLDLVTPLIDDPAELFRLKRLIFAQEALNVELTRASLDHADEVQAYWSNRGRRPIAPVLRRFLNNPEIASIDLLQILPSLPRRLLNTYPDGNNSPTAANCFWTALNFFNGTTTDDRFLPSYGDQDDSAAAAQNALDRDYVRVAPPYRFGDVLALVAVHPAAGEELVHTLNYVAADIVYSKNGYGSASPFILTRLGDVLNFYTWAENLTVRGYRLKPAP